MKSGFVSLLPVIVVMTFAGFLLGCEDEGSSSSPDLVVRPVSEGGDMEDASASSVAPQTNNDSQSYVFEYQGHGFVSTVLDGGSFPTLSGGTNFMIFNPPTAMVNAAQFLMPDGTYQFASMVFSNCDQLNSFFAALSTPTHVIVVTNCGTPVVP